MSLDLVAVGVSTFRAYLNAPDRRISPPRSRANARLSRSGWLEIVGCEPSADRPHLSNASHRCGKCDRITAERLVA
jgi:hypothetical protein